MKTLLVASAFTFGVVGMAASAFADDCNSGGKRSCISAFGDPYEGMVAGKKMHMQFIEDSTGAQWVVIGREEAEGMMGMKMGDRKWVKVPM